MLKFKFTLMNLFMIWLLAFTGTPIALAQTTGEVMVVVAKTAAIYSSANLSKKTGVVMKLGRRVEVAGPTVNGFVPVIAGTGSQEWLRVADLTPERAKSSSRGGSTSFSTSGPDDEGQSHSSILGLERLTFDVGLGGGTYQGLSYTEVDVGLNAYFRRWLAWRNAVFARLTSGADNIYGLDTSVRGILDLPLLTAFAGPGYRFANGSASAPLIEGGLVFKVAGIAIGGGAKVLLDSWVHSGAPNDTQVFFILAGGGAI